MHGRRRLETWWKLSRLAWGSLGDGGERRDVTALTSLLLEDVLRRPILFEDSRGLSYLLYPGENAEVYFQHDGNYEVAETRFCERQVEPGDVVFDVGANVGLYTLLLAKLVGPAGAVHVFEPEETNFRRLQANIALNGADNVRATRAAVFSAPGTVELNVYGERLNAWHSLGRPKLEDPYRRGQIAEPVAQVAVPAVSLDDYCSGNGIDSIDLLKVDVEGAELDVLQGAQGLLASGQVDSILFEVSLPQIESMGHDAHDVFDYLKAHGYTAHALEPDGSLGAPQSTTDVRYGNYVAQRRAAG